MSPEQQFNLLQEQMSSLSNAQQAKDMKRYMKNLFDFYGVKSPERKQVFSEFWRKCNSGYKSESQLLINLLWEDNHRESQYLAMDLMTKFLKQLQLGDLDFIESLVMKKPWWDTVDYLASNPIGSILYRFPDARLHWIEKWMSSDNMWLQRCCLLFQLKYKHEVDADLLSACITDLKGGNEFFINKAIGWALRQYSKFNPEYVRQFLDGHQDLHSLSRREASKYI